MDTKLEINEYSALLQNQLMEIIDKSSIEDSETKQLLSILFSKLADNQTKQLFDLEEKVYTQLSNNVSLQDNFGTVITALVNSSDLNELNSFYPIIENREIISPFDDLDSVNKKNSVLGVFFKCSYERFIEITDSSTYNRTYQIELDCKNGKQLVNCYFRSNISFIQREKYICRVSQQYGFNRPLVFSPYARRFAEIVFCDEVDISSINSIDFKELDFEVEGTTLNKTLVWNLKIEERSLPEISKKISDNVLIESHSDNKFLPNIYVIPGHLYKYRKVFKCKENEWIWFEGIGKERLSILRNKTESQICVLIDEDTIIEPKYRMMLIEPNQIELKKIGVYFDNEYRTMRFIPKRLRSKADIHYALDSFNCSKNYYINDDITIGTKINLDNVILDYNIQHRYYKYISYNDLNSDNMFRCIPSRSEVKCVISFEGNGMFVEDYARYVIEFLNEIYPEYKWFGRWTKI